MAGSLKPDNVKAEANYIINESTLSVSRPYVNLFDGDNATMAQWYPNNVYLDITIKQKCNIWLIPYISSDSGGSYDAPLTIYKYNGSSWDDTNLQLTSKNIGKKYWYKGISNLEAGRYRFVNKTTYRIDYEWYIEGLSTPKFLIKQNENYYSIKPKFFNNGNYQPLILEGEVIPNDNDFTNSGFDNLQDLLMENDKGSVVGIDKGNIGDGKYFSIDFPSGFQGISEVK